MFSRSYFKIGSDLDKTPISKVVDIFLTYKVDFDKILSTVQYLRENLSLNTTKNET